MLGTTPMQRGIAEARGNERVDPGVELSTPGASGRVADAIVSALVGAGVDTFFGIPGGPIGPVFDALAASPRARLIESRHETSAAFSAAGYYRATGKVAAVVVTAGPGATNVLTGLASAHLEQVPMVVICGDVSWAARGSRLLQDGGPGGLDLEHLFMGVTRARVRVGAANCPQADALTALHAADGPVRKGPALLVVPMHEATRRAAGPRVALGLEPRPSPPHPHQIEEIARVLMHAKRPLLVFGGGVRRHARVLRRAAEALGIPFVTTPRAKGIVSEEHPLSLRHGGLAASMWARAYTARGVDAALVLGTDLDDCSIGPKPFIGPNGVLIHVDQDPAVFGRNLPTALGLVADVGEVAELLARHADAERLRHRSVHEELAAARSHSPFQVAEFTQDSGCPITPYRALADLQAAAPENACFVTDIGEHMLFALHYLTARGPDRFVINLGLGSMGSGICSAVGLALGEPGRPVVCVCGDGGMQMNGAEVLVARHEHLRVLFAVFNDARYNMVHHGFRHQFGRDTPWETPRIDFVGWAHAMQVRAARIRKPGELTQALFNDLTAEGPAVLDIDIDRDLHFVGAGRDEALQQMSVLAEDGGAS